MRLSRFVFIAAAATLLSIASGALAQGNDCTAKLRVGNVLESSHSDCTWVWTVDPACMPAGKCPSQQGVQCRLVGTLTYAWTVTQTGGTGSIAVGALTGSTVTVTVTPPATYRVSVVVGGCEACCATPAGCVGPTVAAAPASSHVRTERVRNGKCH